MRRSAKSLIGLLLAAALVLPLGAANAEYFCRMMGRVMQTCCCKAASDASEAKQFDARPQIERADCCEVRIGAAHAAAPAARDGALQMPAPALLAVLAWPEPRADAHPSARLSRARARAPPPTGPPLFLKNCALLT